MVFDKSYLTVTCIVCEIPKMILRCLCHMKTEHFSPVIEWSDAISKLYHSTTGLIFPIQIHDMSGILIPPDVLYLSLIITRLEMGIFIMCKQKLFIEG